MMIPTPAATALALAALLAPAAPAGAGEHPMTAEEFDAYTRGQTLYFSANGQPYGVERYKDGRRVTWSFLDGECKEGVWYQSGEMICFEYDDIAGPQCWTFFERPGGLEARFENRTDSTVLYQTLESDEPMLCLGPEVGV